MVQTSSQRMGTCCSRCCSVIQTHSTPCVRFKHSEDNENLIEFDAEEVSSPVMPKSISSWLSRVRNRFSQEVQLELQERSTAEACREAIRIQELRIDSEIINPAQLAYDNSALWLGDDISKWEMENSKHKNDLSLQEPGISNTSNKACHSEISTPSSIDLEWENENGLSPLTHIPSVDTTSDTASCLSQLSTPSSNEDDELEWDGHFTSTHISNLDVENDDLLREIECLTTDILKSDEDR